MIKQNNNLTYIYETEFSNDNNIDISNEVFS